MWTSIQGLTSVNPFVGVHGSFFHYPLLVGLIFSFIFPSGKIERVSAASMGLLIWIVTVKLASDRYLSKSVCYSNGTLILPRPIGVKRVAVDSIQSVSGAALPFCSKHTVLLEVWTDRGRVAVPGINGRMVEAAVRQAEHESKRELLVDDRPGCLDYDYSTYGAFAASQPEPLKTDPNVLRTVRWVDGWWRSHRADGKKFR